MGGHLISSAINTHALRASWASMPQRNARRTATVALLAPLNTARSCVGTHAATTDDQCTYPLHGPPRPGYPPPFCTAALRHSGPPPPGRIWYKTPRVVIPQPVARLASFPPAILPVCPPARPACLTVKGPGVPKMLPASRQLRPSAPGSPAPCGALPAAPAPSRAASAAPNRPAPGLRRSRACGAACRGRSGPRASLLLQLCPGQLPSPPGAAASRRPRAAAQRAARCARTAAPAAAATWGSPAGTHPSRCSTAPCCRSPGS
jgi:hypothetical protein